MEGLEPRATKPKNTSDAGIVSSAPPRPRIRLGGSVEHPSILGKAAMKASHRLPQFLSSAVDFRE